MGKYVIHDCNLYIVILVLRRAPTDACFQTTLAKHGNAKDMCFYVFEEVHVVLTCTYSKLFSDVLEEVYMADLNNDIGEDIDSCLFDCQIIITRHRDEWVIHVLELCEELYPRLKAL